MSTSITNQPVNLSPFRFDMPSGEADVDPDQIAVLDGPGSNGSGAAQTEFGFKDFLDVINPLQHIPIVSTIYRAITGDEIGPAPRAIGGALYGGPVGVLAALGNNIMEAETGSDLGETAIAMLTDSDAPGGRTGTPPSSVETPQLAAAPADPITEPPAAAAFPAIPVDRGPVAPVSTANAALEAPTLSPASSGPSPFFARLAAKPPGISGSFIPSDATLRAGLFGAGPNPVPLPSASAHGNTGSTGLYAEPLQSAPEHALDRLIARSQAQQASRSSAASSSHLPVPTDNSNVHEWMLKALGKYETMPKS